MSINSKFKANPYNKNNKLICNFDIINIMETLNINNFIVNDIDLYQRAFIHKSYCTSIDYSEFDNDEGCLELQDISYETLEFLGDSILTSVVASYLYDRYYKIYNQTEGFLTKIKTRLVCGENLAKLSSYLKLDKFMIISKHIEESCDGRNNMNILEDIFESLIGAIYEDSGYEMAKEFIIKVIESYVDFTDIILRDNNYKDQIIKYLQHNYKEHPKYEIKNVDDDFICNFIFKGDIISVGNGKSKKKAEQNASMRALYHFNVLTE